MSKFSTITLLMFLIPSFVGGFFIGLGLNYSPFPVEIPSLICSPRIKLDNLDLLDQLITNFNKENPWDNSTNYTCLPRATDFLTTARLLGFKGTVEFGCKEKKIQGINQECHAWPRIYLDLWGGRSEYPVLLGNTSLEYWQNQEKIMVNSWPLRSVE